MNKVIVCGGRYYDDVAALTATLDAIHTVTPITCIIEGGATGADFYAAAWARSKNIDTIRVDANWKEYGRAAGPKRNLAMLALGPQLVVAFPGGRGTANMVKQAKKAGVFVKEISS